ncbi:hypothetical protein ADUPG1_005510, partial [Aduncisulcus paluster]
MTTVADVPGSKNYIADAGPAQIEIIHYVSKFNEMVADDFTHGCRDIAHKTVLAFHHFFELSAQFVFIGITWQAIGKTSVYLRVAKDGLVCKGHKP